APPGGDPGGPRMKVSQTVGARTPVPVAFIESSIGLSGSAMRLSGLVRARGARTPGRVAFAESGTGWSGATMSLSVLVRRLDRERFEPHVIVARDDQGEYLAEMAGRARARIAPPPPLASR